MAVISPHRGATPVDDGAGARADPPDDRGAVACFQVEDGGALRLIWTIPLPAESDAVAAAPGRPG